LEKTRKEIKKRKVWKCHADRVTVDVGNNVLKLNNEKMFRWFGQVMRMPGNRENPRMGTRGNRKEGKTQIEMYG